MPRQAKPEEQQQEQPQSTEEHGWPQDHSDATVPEVWGGASHFTREQLTHIESFDDAARLAAQEFGDIVSAHESTALGDGFRVASEDDKMRLIGVPLLLLEWSLRESEYGEGVYVSIKAIQRDESGRAIKWILNDGSTGIARDLQNFTLKTGRSGGLGVRKGLRVSEYPTNAIKGHPDNGKPLSKAEHREFIKAGHPVGKGRTFYLDASA